jgi:hypothetical protein
VIAGHEGNVSNSRRPSDLGTHLAQGSLIR